ncbi:MAG: hypothetical protein ACYC9L_14970 [Sulfuricaulis sp.]
MIAESQYWKDDLAKNVSFIHDKLYQTVWREASFVALEKRIMLSCYIVRKLAESNKIKKERFVEPVKLYSYRNKGELVDLLNSHRIDELYEVEKATEITKPFSYVANQIIHSYIFLYSFKDRNKIDGIIFNSDKSKQREVYRLTLKELLRVLSPIAQCYVGRTIMQRNENGEMVVVHSEEDH